MFQQPDVLKRAIAHQKTADMKRADCPEESKPVDRARPFEPLSYSEPEEDENTMIGKRVMEYLKPNSLKRAIKDKTAIGSKRVLVPSAGFEPATVGLENRCSSVLSYDRKASQ